MDDLKTILKYIIALILSLVLAAFGFRIIRSSIDILRYGTKAPEEIGYNIENSTVYDSDENYEDEYLNRMYYEDDQPSEEEIREMDERLEYLRENTDFGFFDQNFIYMMTNVGSDYLDLFFDEDWMIREDYDGYYGEDYDERMEFWTPDSEKFNVIAYVFEGNALFVNFPDDGFYVYYDVDKDTFAGLLRTDSQDEYFDEYINGRFVSKRLT